MTSSRKNKTLFIDREAASVLELVADGLLSPVTKLMSETESKQVLETGLIDDKSFPFPFILAPSGRKNEEIISSLELGEDIIYSVREKSLLFLALKILFK